MEFRSIDSLTNKNNPNRNMSRLISIRKPSADPLATPSQTYNEECKNFKFR